MLRHHILLLCLALPFASQAQPDCRPDALKGELPAEFAEPADAINSTKLCEEIGITFAKIKLVLDQFKASEVTAGRHLSTDTPPGMPSGIVVAIDGAVRFDLNEVSREQIRLLTISADDRPFKTYEKPPLILDVPIEKYGPDTIFSWKLTTGKHTYQGEFNLAIPADQAAVLNKITLLKQQPLGEKAKLIYQAAIFNDAGLYADRDRVFAELRRRTGM